MTTTTRPTSTWQFDVTIADVDVSGDNASFTASATVARTDIGVDPLRTVVTGRDLQQTVAAKGRRAS